MSDENAYIEKKAANSLNRLVTPEDVLRRFDNAGLKAKHWGKTLFGVSANVDPQAPALLVYFPDVMSQQASLSALLLAAESWHKQLPITLKVLVGSVTEQLLSDHKDQLDAKAIIYSLGEYSGGRPLISLGMKGLLEVELKVKTLGQPAPSAYSEIMPAASWSIVRALDSIKSDAQEVQIYNFEESITALPAGESRRLSAEASEQSERLQARLKQYGLEHYIFELSERLVLQTEYRVPTVNISAIECGKFKKNGRLKLPATARAQLDLHLVPDQNPDRIFEQIQEHLKDKNFTDLEAIRLPGSLSPTRTLLDTPFVLHLLQVAQSVIGKPAFLAPISPFAGPLALLRKAADDAPAVCYGLSKETDLVDFTHHARVMSGLFVELAALYPSQPELSFEMPPEFDESVTPEQ